ncbi:helix-turn-helix transcriptional regulator [Halomonas cerina]|uniref:AraC-like DNA-binding protein/ActR/RegA family two-component response regulator n=1 Tax=Halomonas cerina TaxID=447424 RepID=A0A839V6U1_9GAMM|nr:DNA-binding response regulator [Halomonas cerina]MBB3189259.1 AraC-like DNA-binding protein/ActR/RegA family two-component response regulator [Halomonas cerina]
MQVQDYVLIVLRNLQESLDSDYVEVLKRQGYPVEFVQPGEDPIPRMQHRPPVVCCLHFDYPDWQGLTDLRRIKQEVTSVPLLMITQAHSERLAVWAFRARVWDYFVQPVDTSRLLEVIASLRSVRIPGAGAPAPRRMPAIDNAMPPEARLRCQRSGGQQPLLDRALAYIDQNLHRKIAQAEVAELCELNTFQFSRLFKKLTGVTFQEYLQHRRIAEAMRLLANPKASVTDVCFTVGFRDLSYFTRIFQRYVGLPPSRYRLSLDKPRETPLFRHDEPFDFVPPSTPKVDTAALMRPLWAAGPER